MHKLTENLIIFADSGGNDIISRTAELCRNAENGVTGLKKEAYTIVRELLQAADAYGFSGNLWKSAVARYIAFSENTFSLKLENGGTEANRTFAYKDCQTLKEIFNYDFSSLEKALDADCFSAIANYKNTAEPSDAGEAIEALKQKLDNSNDFFQTISDFYQEHGVGVLGLSKAFTVKEKAGNIEFVPVRQTEKVSLSDLIGYQVQKQKLVENTEAFLNKRPANNVLLFGDGGTGKSTSVRAIINQYHKDGLRIIQVCRHQMEYLSRIIEKVKQRNYRFIIYMDDLSFEDFETEYKYLKAVIEGGLEPRPENVLIYATSNRRHLIKETWKDRDDMEHTGEMHRSDSIEEKLSLAERFGVQIYYGKPTREEFHGIVEALALKEGVSLSLEEIHKEATKWEIRRGGVSGRSARQFIDYIKGTEEHNK